MLDLNPLEDALEDVRRELLAARAEQEQLANKIESLQTEARGLELAIARHGGRADSTSGPTRWTRMSRTEAIEVVLLESENPLGAAGITKELQKHGRDDTRDHVAAALAYLKRKGRVDHHENIAKYSKEDPTKPLDFEGGDSP